MMEEDFSEFINKVSEAIKMKDRHFNEALSKVKDAQIRIELQLEQVKQEGNKEKIMYVQGLSDGMKIIEPLIKYANND